MSQAKPIQLKTNKAGRIFAKIKNGNIYRLNAIVAPDRAASVISRIEDAGKINLKHWTRCNVDQPHLQEQDASREGGSAPRDEYFAVWEKRCREAHDALNTYKLSGMVARKEKKLAALTASDCPKDQDLIYIVSRELEIAQEWLRDAQETARVAA